VQCDGGHAALGCRAVGQSKGVRSAEEQRDLVVFDVPRMYLDPQGSRRIIDGRLVVIPRSEALAGHQQMHILRHFRHGINQHV
jgi:hypothetical protein